MTRLTVLPHPTAVVGVTAEPWMIEMHGRSDVASALLPGWDYSVPVRFQRTVKVDIDDVKSQCELGPDALLGLTATLDCPSTFLRLTVPPVEVTSSERYDIAISPRSSDIAGSVRLDLCLVLLEGVAGQSPLAATLPGSVLWREESEARTRIALEGDATRFPTEARDFSSSGLFDPDAAWYLDLDLAQLDASPMHAVRLIVNEGHPGMARVIRGDDDPEAVAMSSAMYWDVARRMIHTALDQVDFVESWGHHSEDSIGLVIEQLIKRVFPNDDATTLHGDREFNPDRFEARLQGRLRLFLP
jgi:hypothetical protein